MTRLHLILSRKFSPSLPLHFRDSLPGAFPGGRRLVVGRAGFHQLSPSEPQPIFRKAAAGVPLSNSLLHLIRQSWVCCFLAPSSLPPAGGKKGKDEAEFTYYSASSLRPPTDRPTDHRPASEDWAGTFSRRR